MCVKGLLLLNQIHFMTQTIILTLIFAASFIAAIVLLCKSQKDFEITASLKELKLTAKARSVRTKKQPTSTTLPS